MQSLGKFKKKILLLQASIVATIVLMAFIAIGLSFVFLNLSEIYDRQTFFVASVIPLFYLLASLYVFFSYEAHKPRGLIVDKNSAPELVKYVENIISDYGSNASFDSIILTTGCSIYVYNEPSLINFLRPKPPILVIGNSLLRYLSKEEFGATLAHEISHLSQPQSYYKAYLAEISNKSALLAATGESVISRVSFMSIYGLPTKIIEKVFAALYRSFFYSKKNEYLELERQMELEADDISAKKYGSRNLLRALTKSCLLIERRKIFRRFIYPFIQLQGTCPDYWRAFNLCDGFFSNYDGASISVDGYLEIHNESLFMMSLDRESLLTIERINRLAEQAGPNENIYTGPNCLISEKLRARIDKAILLNDKNSSSETLDDDDITEFLEALRLGVFNEAQTLEDIEIILSEIQEELKILNVTTPVVMPLYAAPSCDVVPSPFIVNPTYTLYQSDELHCPVCGKEVGQDEKVCPHCQEVIAE